MAKEVLVLLPDIMETLQDGNADVKMNALLFLWSVMGHLRREEASLVGVQLAEKLLPLFDDGSSQVRELAIRLFEDVIKAVVGRSKKKMKKMVQRVLVLLPLLLHMSDQVESVAKASGCTLLTCVEFLGWRLPSYMSEPYRTQLIEESLLAHNKSKVEEYVQQSLTYLEAAQATLREAAVRFIGLAARHRRRLSRETLLDVCNALQPLGRDASLSVRSLASETVFVLTPLKKQKASGWSLPLLFCCFS
ncbi:maestro heat-like repeat-containing protein family member 7 [Leptosomus discolor]